MSEEFKLGYFEKIIRTELINCARYGRTISYQKLCSTTSLLLEMNIQSHREELAEILDDISVYEILHKRPPLSAIVELAKKDDVEPLPGIGFFKLCKKHEMQLKELLNCEKLVPSISKKKEFARARQSDCYVFWKNIDNYKAYKDIPKVTKPNLDTEDDINE